MEEQESSSKTFLSPSSVSGCNLGGLGLSENHGRGAEGSPPILCEFKLGNTLVRGMIDDGASVSIISPGIAEELLKSESCVQKSEYSMTFDTPGLGSVDGPYKIDSPITVLPPSDPRLHIGILQLPCFSFMVLSC